MTHGMVGAYSCDTSDVSWQAPLIGFRTTCAVLGTPGHSWQSTAQYGMGIGHKGLIFAAKTIAACVLDLLTKPDLLNMAKDEFAKRMQNRVYTPMPQEIKPPIEESMALAEASSARIAEASRASARSHGAS